MSTDDASTQKNDEEVLSGTKGAGPLMPEDVGKVRSGDETREQSDAGPDDKEKTRLEWALNEADHRRNPHG